MEVNEIETQLQIVHYSEQNQQFFFQTKKEDIPPPNYAAFWITNHLKFKEFYKYLESKRSKAPGIKISFKFLVEQHEKYKEKKNRISLLDVLVQEAIHINKYN